uniref:Uncharacterized protein n=1 Tax=Opuntia streptacantha TaxID=393608 RepID=A0A7C8Z8A4_OPUST
MIPRKRRKKPPDLLLSSSESLIDSRSLVDLVFSGLSSCMRFRLILVPCFLFDYSAAAESAPTLGCSPNQPIGGVHQKVDWDKLPPPPSFDLGRLLFCYDDSAIRSQLLVAIEAISENCSSPWKDLDGSIGIPNPDRTPSFFLARNRFRSERLSWRKSDFVGTDLDIPLPGFPPEGDGAGSLTRPTTDSQSIRFND